MKKITCLLAVIIGAQQLTAQVPEDALRMSWVVPGGTARQQAIGGAMGSLGGDISALYVNPAGLGFYKTSEIVLSPGFSFYKGKGSFRGTDATSDQLSRFNLGASGLVLGWQDPYSKWSNKAFSIGVNRTANFNSTSYYKGANDFSSFSENMANEFFDYYTTQKDNNPSRSDADIINDALDEPNISLLTKMGLYTYLIDIDSSSGQKRVVSRAEQAGIVNQENRITSTGGITEIALGYAANMDDKLYLGGSIGIPIVNYKRTTVYRESDFNGTGNNKFNSSELREEYSSKGVGFNVKLGLIFKPANFVRVGVAVHSPSFYALKDKFSSTMTTDVDTLFNNPVSSVNSSVFFGGDNPNYKFNLTSPWRFLVSGSYVFREAADVNQQRGFVTADIEYVTYGSSRLSSGEDYEDDDDYYKQVTDAVKAAYKGAFNFRVGGELKFNTLMTRLGFAYYGNPYDDKQLKARKINLSGGLGYRDKGIFIDLTYVHSLFTDVNFPYRLDPPRPNTFADLKENRGTVLLTFGFKI